MRISFSVLSVLVIAEDQDAVQVAWSAGWLGDATHGSFPVGLISNWARF